MTCRPSEVHVAGAITGISASAKLLSSVEQRLQVAAAVAQLVGGAGGADDEDDAPTTHDD